MQFANSAVSLVDIGLDTMLCLFHLLHELTRAACAFYHVMIQFQRPRDCHDTRYVCSNIICDCDFN